MELAGSFRKSFFYSLPHDGTESSSKKTVEESRILTCMPPHQTKNSSKDRTWSSNAGLIRTVWISYHFTFETLKNWLACVNTIYYSIQGQGAVTMAEWEMVSIQGSLLLAGKETVGFPARNAPYRIHLPTLSGPWNSPIQITHCGLPPCVLLIMHSWRVVLVMVLSNL